MVSHEAGVTDVGNDPAGPAPSPPPGWWRRLRRRAHGYREAIRARPGHRRLYQIVVAVVGGVLVLGGLALVPFPGPGWLVVLIGLAVLASEFSWADRLQSLVRRTLTAWMAWLSRQSWPVRALVGLGTLVVVVATGYGLLLWQGMPEWVPDGITARLPGF